MTAIIVSTLVMSLLGSLHCAGMCGAFLALAVSPGEAGPRWAAPAAYHLGRLASYAALGAAAGALGDGINKWAEEAGWADAATVLAAVVMAAFGVHTLLRCGGWCGVRWSVPRPMRSAAMSAHRRALRLPGVPRAAAIGVLTPMIPCAWLYAFAATAGGTGSAAEGSAVMIAFWAGTLPVMVTLGAGLSAGLGRLSARLPVLTALMLVAASVGTIAGRSWSACHEPETGAVETRWCNDAQ